MLHGLLLSTSTQWGGAAAPFVKAGQARPMSSPETIEGSPLSPWEVGARNLFIGVWHQVFVGDLLGLPFCFPSQLDGEVSWWGVLPNRVSRWESSSGWVVDVCVDW